jgi:cephalosporin hydroxylase
MFDREEFETEKRQALRAQGESESLARTAREFTEQTHINRYTYQWTWLGMPIIQMPGDVVAMQEIVWQCRPDLIIETGIAWGGSTLFYASLLELIGKGRVIAVDKVLPDHNRKAILDNRFAHRMTLVEGSSVDPAIVAQVKQAVVPGETVMVVLDSHHTHDHVHEELRAYAPLVSRGSYAVVFDTVVETIQTDPSLVRAWGKGNNPASAVDAFLAEDSRFERDRDYDAKILASYAPGGFLRRVG